MAAEKVIVKKAKKGNVEKGMARLFVFEREVVSMFAVIVLKDGDKIQITEADEAWAGEELNAYFQDEFRGVGQ